MKGLLTICAIGALCYFTGIHNSVLGFLGIGGAQYGISSHDPLGAPEKIHRTLTRIGFVGELGKLNTPRTIVYTNPYDEKLYPGFSAALVVTVGDEEYIQKVEGVFIGSQHGYSPQKPTMVEQQMVALWRAVHGPRTSFKRVDDAPFVVPRSVKFGPAISIPQHHMEFHFSNDDVKGFWVYGEDSPLEVIRLELK